MIIFHFATPHRLQRRSLSASVTRHGAIWPLWQNFKVFGQHFKALFTIWQILNLLWQIFYTFGQIDILINGQILKNILHNHLVTLSLLRFCIKSIKWNKLFNKCESGEIGPKMPIHVYDILWRFLSKVVSAV